MSAITPVPSIPQTLDLPPMSAAAREEAPNMAAHLDRLMLALRTQNGHIATAVTNKSLAGLAANLPPANTPGRTYYAVDTHQLWADDGTVWTVV
jgi:hypothetical protein